MATIYRYKFDGFSVDTLIGAINSMGGIGTGILVASVPSGVFIDISVPDGLDVALVDSLVGYPYTWTRVGVASTPNVRVATVRVKRNAVFLVSGTPTQLEWDALSTLSPTLAIDLTSGDLVPLVSGLMRVDAQVCVSSLLGLASLTMRVIRSPSSSPVTVAESPPMGATSAACNVQFGITAGVPVRVEIEKSGGVGNATGLTSEILTFCCANVIVS
jgi:hypothetical protein